MDKNIIAYSGKIVEYDKQRYILEPEHSIAGCSGCDLVNKGCNEDVFKYCCQGYILKQLNSNKHENS